MKKIFDSKSDEPRLYRMWEEAGAFKAGANARRTDTFCIMLPPPNVTGHLHVGHAFNHTLMDILTRWKRMQGFDTLWQPGLDHAGIATQLMVEKDLAETGQPRRTELGRTRFLEKVWAWKAEKGGTIEYQDRRLGSGMDYTRSAFTMSGAESAPACEPHGNFHDAVIKVFVEMYTQGLIYRGKRLVNWDPHFETAISDLEVETVETPGHMWHFKYPLAGGETYLYVEKDADGNVICEEERNYIAIATTRPETILGDGAIAVNPSDARYAPIVGKLCEIPVGPRQHRRLIPIILDEYPDPSFGSGAVKITGAHDFNDYQVARRANIPMYRLMDSKGAMRTDGQSYDVEAATAQAIADRRIPFDESMVAAINLVPDAYRGLDRFEARKRVVADITAEGNAVMVTVATDDGPVERPLVEAKSIMQPYGDRSKVVIEPMLTDQWFVDSDKLVGPALDAVRSGRVRIMPESGEKVFFHWLENIEPWCISRQLWWGHQIPVWYGPDRVEFSAGPSAKSLPPKAFCAATEAEVLEQARAYYGPGVGLSCAPADNEGSATAVRDMAADSATGKIEGITLRRDPDVLDTWFSSGLWPFGTLGWPADDPAMRYFPGDVLITGEDILFFWVARMMMMSEAVMKKEPFHTVYLHQLLRDARGEKMSKTRGNVIDPLDMIDRYGADALRFSNAAMASIGGVLKMSEDRIKGYRNFGTKLWNAFSFAEHYHVPNTGNAQRLETHLTLNRWIIGEAGKVRVTVDTALTQYRFNDAADALYAFVWGKVCDWYLELSKPILQGVDAAAQDETGKTLRWVLDQCLILLHPIMPFITEELWGLAAARDTMLVHAVWPEYGTELVDPAADREMNWVIELVESIRSARAQSNVPAGATLPLLVRDLDPRGQEAWARNEALIMRLTRVSRLDHVTAFSRGCVTIPMDGCTFGFSLAGLIVPADEIARLEKALQKLAKELGGLRGRACNPAFVQSAPSEVVAEVRENLRLREGEDAQIREAIARLREIG